MAAVGSSKTILSKPLNYSLTTYRFEGFVIHSVLPLAFFATFLVCWETQQPFIADLNAPCLGRPPAATDRRPPPPPRARPRRTYLLHLANSGSLAVISIGYRLAPENPFPAAPEDCYDAIDHLAKTSQSTYNAPLRFIGGESAGAHLALLSALHLLSQPASPPLSGLILNFGVYDLSFLPQARNFPEPLILTPDIMAAFVEAFVPEAKNKPELLKDPKISPFYADLSKYESLPPALFMLGTADALLEDSMFMATRWMVAGGEAVVKLFAGATHAFISFPVEKCPAAGEAMAVTREFLVEKVG